MQKLSVPLSAANIIMRKPVHVLAVLTLWLLFALSASGAAAWTVSYHGNARSKVFHQASCRYYDCKNCTVAFPSRDAAIRAGYRPCKICKP